MFWGEVSLYIFTCCLYFDLPCGLLKLAQDKPQRNCRWDSGGALFPCMCRGGGGGEAHIKVTGVCVVL